MTETTFEIKFTFKLMHSLLRKYEIDLVNKLATSDSLEQKQFLEAVSETAGQKMRDMMDNAPRSAGDRVGDILYGRPNWTATEPHPTSECAERGCGVHPVLNISVPAINTESLKWTLNKEAAERFPVPDVSHPMCRSRCMTRKEAIAACRKAERVRADQRLVARKTKRTLAAVKGHATRAKRAKARKVHR